jgi:hypothetical protein
VARTGPELVSWASKAAIKASSQLYGALRVPAGAEMWCDHRRRGRVQFCGGLPKINHAIALIEVFEAVDLQAGASDLPLVYNNVPISYLSLNDFLNLAVELRTTPELLEYLTARRSLPEADLRLIGDERSLFEFYLLNNGSFGGCASRADATRVVDGAKDRLQQAIQLKAEADRPAALLEHVADALATRHPANAETLSEKLLAPFDPPEERKSYLELQAVITNLRLRERTELGSSFEETIRRSAVETEGLIYKAVHVHSRPDWVFVFGSSKKIDRTMLLGRMRELLSGATAFFKKQNCFVCVNRDGEGYEVASIKLQTPPTAIEEEIGRRRFGHLRIGHKELRFTPAT